MRLRFLPLALCLLCVFSVKSAMLFSENNAALVGLKTADFKAVSAKVKTEKPTKDLSETKEVNTSYKSPNTSIAYFRMAGVQNAQKQLYEEFSYNNDESIFGGMATISQKNDTINAAETENLAISFKNGMYYGFALMVILLNLVCYFLFDEKVFLHYA